MASVLRTYTDAASTMDEWISDVAPNYFNFDNVANYRTGVFGYVNEVMSTVSEDCFHSVSIARREFYPTHAQYTESIYRMGALQQLDVPMSVPARVKALLVIKEKDISPTIDNGEDYIIKDNLTFMVNTIPFMLDHNIIISGSKSTSRFNGVQKSNYVYTVRYDNSTRNSLDDSNQVYLQNMITNFNGENVLYITAYLRQVQMDEREIEITKNALIEVVDIDIPFSGKLANFEVFYTENAATAEVQLQKILINSDSPRIPFVQYMVRTDSRLQLHFPSSIYFTPKWQSKIRVRVYTTLGSEGNFDKYEGNITCNYPRSTTPRAASVIIDGNVVSASAGGMDRNDLDDFRSNVIFAYATNETICTDNDLQLYFDRQMMSDQNKIVFFKKRDDAFQRLYGAFMLLKDENKMVIPTNTVDIVMNQGLEQMSGDSKHLISSTGLTDRVIDYEEVINDIRIACKALPEWSKSPPHGPYDCGVEIIETDASTDDYIVYGKAERDDIINALWACVQDKFGFKSEFMKAHQGDYIHIVSLVGTGVGAVIAVALKHEGYSDFDEYYDGTDRLMLLPGAIFRYNEGVGEEQYTVSRDRNFNLNQNFADYETTCNRIRATLRTMYVYNETVTVSEIDGDHYEITGVTQGDGDSSAFDTFMKELKTRYRQSYRTELTQTEDYGQFFEDDGIIYINLSYFLYTNPFIISIMRAPNAVMYYLNSCDKRLTFDYKEIASGEQSYIQFILNSMRITRNAIVGENFYTFEISIAPSVINADVAGNACNYKQIDTTQDTNVIVDELGNEKTIQVLRRAKGDGYVGLVQYLNESDSPDGYAGVFANIIYDDTQLGSEKIRVSSQYVSDGREFKTVVGHTMKYQTSETFRKDDVLAVRKLDDKGIIRCMLTINGAEFSDHGRYIPLIIEEYDQSNSYFTLRGYCSITDEISAENYTILPRGVYNRDGTECNAKEVTITMNNCTFDLYTFIHYADRNDPGIYSDYAFIKNNYSFTNHYAMSGVEKFSFIEPVEYIRSVANVGYVDDGKNHLDGVYGTTTYRIKGVPLVKAQWARSVTNSYYLANAIFDNYQEIDAVYTYLEENFAIDLKFFNTYGRSRFYEVGHGNNDEDMKPLNHVNCSISVGVRLNTLTSEDEFRTRFVTFVKDYVESMNDIENEGRPIYLLSLTAACQQEFEEILWIEYYGINDYDSSAQRVVSNFQETIKKLGYNEYVPEFINIDSTDETGTLVPAVNLTILEA